MPNEQDLFAQSIIYIADHPDVPGGKRQYNGNINQLHWCIFGREGTEIYGFAYDDLLGNIGHLSRRGLTGYTDPDQSPTFGLMDDLSYTYAHGQLTQVAESGNPDYGYLILRNSRYRSVGREVEKIIKDHESQKLDSTDFIIGDHPIRCLCVDV